MKKYVSDIHGSGFTGALVKEEEGPRGDSPQHAGGSRKGNLPQQRRRQTKEAAEAAAAAVAHVGEPEAKTPPCAFVESTNGSAESEATSAFELSP